MGDAILCGAGDAQEQPKTPVTLENLLEFFGLARKVNLKELSKEDQEKADKFIADLDDNHFPTRQAASQGLRDLGVAAMPKIYEAASSPVLERRRRAERIIGEMVAPKLIPHKTMFEKEPLKEKLIARFIGEVELDPRAQLKELVKQIDEFTNNPKLLEQRKSDIEQLLAQHSSKFDELSPQERKGRIKLTDEQQASLKEELRMLRRIKELSGEVRFEIATEAMYRGDHDEARQYLLEAIQKCPDLVRDPHFAKIVIRTDLDKDQDFMKKANLDEFAKRELEQFRKEREEKMKNLQNEGDKPGGGKNNNVMPGIPAVPGIGPQKVVPADGPIT